MFKTIKRFRMPVFAPEGGDGGGGGDGSGTAGAVPPGNGAAGAGGGASGFDWAGSLGGDFERFKPLIESDRLTDPKGALTAYETMKTAQAGMVTVPGKDATPEQRAAFYTRLGRPESPDKYDLSTFKPPENLPWDGKAQTAVVAHMHSLGLTNEQVVGVLGGYGQVYAAQALEGAAAADAAAAAFAKEARATLEKEWGADYGARMELANRAVKDVFGDSFGDLQTVRLQDGRCLLDHPGVARALAAIGARAAEPGGLPGLGGGNGAGGETAISTEEYYIQMFNGKS